MSNFLQAHFLSAAVRFNGSYPSDSVNLRRFVTFGIPIYQKPHIYHLAISRWTNSACNLLCLS